MGSKCSKELYKQNEAANRAGPLDSNGGFMGRMNRIAKAVLREMNYGSVKVVGIPDVSETELLEGRFALVTGGSSGIGLEIAKRFAWSGCCVVITGTNETKLEKALSIIDSPKVKAFAMDITEVAALSGRLEESARLFPEQPCFDILVNSAGVALNKPFDKMDEKTFDKVMDTNLKGSFFMAQAMAEHMIRNKTRGNILNISSASALRPAKGPYEISKWGIKGMTLGLAEELIPYGIVVNALGPGPTATPMFDKDGASDLLHVPNPSGRLAHPVEIARLAQMMVSGACDLVVGDTLYATGGAGTICIDR